MQVRRIFNATATFFALCTVACLATSTLALAQKLPKGQGENWPTKPVKILVGFPGGTTPDMAARTLAEPLSKALGQPVIVENRPVHQAILQPMLSARPPTTTPSA